jgi:hypothetical protein
MVRHISTLASIACLAACTTHATREPMTASEHERAASEHGDAARSAFQAYEPDATPGLPCLLMGMKGGSSCFGKRENPTSDARQRAELEVKRATEHLEAARALREEEDRACRGIAEEQRERGPVGGTSPFSTQPLVDFPDPTTVRGVVLVFGSDLKDADALQAAVECHRARIAHRGPGFQPHVCALDDLTLTANVIVSSGGLLLQLRSDDEAAAVRALERARESSRAARGAPRHPAPRPSGS